MLNANYHTHCKYCHHAIGEVKDYITKAISLNFKEIGMTDHAPCIENLCEAYGDEYARFRKNMLDEDVDNYLSDIDECITKYGKIIKIYKGFETEYLPKGIEYYKKLRSKVDYLVLGVHYFEHNDKIVVTYDDFNMNCFSINDYARACVEGMKSGLYSIMAHPDLFMLAYKNINGERKFDDAARIASRKIIECAVSLGIPLEINANGLKFKDSYTKDCHEWCYPYYEFWDIVKEYPDAKILIGADAHNPEFLDCVNTNLAIKFAKMYGFKVLNLKDE